MASFWSSIGPYITQGASALSAYDQGKRERQQQDMQNLMLLRQLRQQDEDRKMTLLMNNTKIKDMEAQQRQRDALAGKAGQTNLDWRPVIGADGTVTYQGFPKATTGGTTPPAGAQPTPPAPSAPSAPSGTISGYAQQQLPVEGAAPPQAGAPAPGASGAPKPPAPPQTPVTPPATPPPAGTPQQTVTPVASGARVPPKVGAGISEHDKLNQLRDEILKANPGMNPDTATARARQRRGYAPTPQPAETITILPPDVPGAPPKGVTTHGPRSQLGKTIEIPGVTKAVPGDAMSATSISDLTRVHSAILGLGVADDQMRLFEKLYNQKKASFNGWDEFVRSVADAEAHTGGDVHAVNRAIIAEAIVRLNRGNPELAKYVKALDAWALEDSNISRRPSDFRVRLDEVVSGIGPEAQPDLVAFVQKLRDVRRQGYEFSMPAIETKLLRARAGAVGPGGGRGGGGDIQGAPTGAPLVPPGASPDSVQVTVGGKKFWVPKP